MVADPAGGADEQGGRVAEVVDLRFDRVPAVAYVYLVAGRHLFPDLLDLHGQFARGGQNQALHLRNRRVEPLQDRQQERHGFTRAGRRDQKCVVGLPDGFLRGLLHGVQGVDAQVGQDLRLLGIGYHAPKVRLRD